MQVLLELYHLLGRFIQNYIINENINTTGVSRLITNVQLMTQKNQMNKHFTVNNDIFTVGLLMIALLLDIAVYL